MATNDISDVIPGSLSLVAAGPAHKDELCSMLEQSSMFGNLSRRRLEALANYVRAFRAEKDTTIFIEGQLAGFMCIIIEGRLTIFKDSGTGRSKQIAEVGPGKSLGEMSMIDGLPHSATAVAIEPVTLVMLTRDDLNRILEEKPRLAVKILWQFAQLMSQRLRRISGMFVDSLE